ncbi:cell wall-binding repeat-containing protein [Clostridium lundense]|uniref:cell wall-binding repeat-containing protein n=1 Tax=Clostridium lundense TaxID=319475 RepID=UPI000A999632|nr:cell wall-binding repeat-containing protein [Clostridium lundense]
MKKCNSFLFGLVTLLTITSVSVTVSAASKSTRLHGKDRFKTNSAVVEDGWQKADNVVLVNGENYPDSLSAAVLAKKYNAPIVLTRSNALDSNTKNLLQRLRTKKVYIVGGEGVINPNIERELNKLYITTERICGQDRYETSLAVAKKIGTSNGIILATGKDYTDALSAAPIAAKLQIPILLVPKNNIPSYISNSIKSRNVTKTYVVGGNDIISDNVANAFSNVKRINGKDKYERNINVIKEFENKLDLSNAILAYSEGFADALSGTAYAALKNSPIVLTDKNPTGITKDYIKNKNVKNLIVLGGTAGITDETINNLCENNGDNYSNKNTSKNGTYNEVMSSKDTSKNGTYNEFMSSKDTSDNGISNNDASSNNASNENTSESNIKKENNFDDIHIDGTIEVQISKYNHSSGNDVKFIVVHDTGNYKDTAKANAHYFGGGDRQASAHYFVDENCIVQVVEEYEASWHCGDGGMKYGIGNHNSISIEMCNSGGYIDEKTINNTLELAKHLMKKYNVPIENVVRHYDASRKICPNNMSANDWAKWKEFKARLSEKITGNSN